MIWQRDLWNWTSPIWWPALVWAIAYALLVRPKTPRSWVATVVGLALLVGTYVSPIDSLSDGLIFSAHMVHHLLLLLVVPLCLLLSITGRAEVGDQPMPNWARKWLPMVGWVCGVGAMWFWHVPNLCSAAAQNASLALVRDTSFVIAGVLFWWPIYSPIAGHRLAPLRGVSYLFSACLGCTLLGIYITFTSISVCPVFAKASLSHPIVADLRAAGFSADVDQRLGGLLMWVPPCLIYIGSIVTLLNRWYTENQHPEAARIPYKQLPTGA